MYVLVISFLFPIKHKKVFVNQGCRDAKAEVYSPLGVDRGGERGSLTTKEMMGVFV